MDGSPAPYSRGPRRGRSFWGGHGYGYGPSYAPTGGSGCGCLSSIVGTLLTLVVAAVLLFATVPASCASSLGSSGSQQTPTQVTTSRTKLPSSQCTPIDLWYQDLAEWIDDPSALTTGMKTFYSRTGVQPYLIIATSIQGKKDYTIAEVESYMRGCYDDLFGSDDGHLILLFCEPYDGQYDPYLLVGANAQAVIDTDAENIIYDALDFFYSDASLSNSAYFGTVFSESAESIMATGVTTTEVVSEPASTRSTNPLLFGVAAVACGGLLAFVILRVIRSRN